jgi:hypothetical protein
MLDVFCLWCNCLDSCFIFITLCTFTRIYFCSSFTCFCHTYLCSPPSSGFSTRLRALLDPFTMSSCATFARSFIFHHLCTAFSWAFVSCLRTQYSNNGYPSNYACVRWGYLLWDLELVLVLLTLFVYQIARTL